MLKSGRKMTCRTYGGYDYTFTLSILGDGRARIIDDSTGYSLDMAQEAVEPWMASYGAAWCSDEDKTDPGIKPAKAKPVRHQPSVPCPKCKGTNTIALFTSVECRDCDPPAPTTQEVYEAAKELHALIDKQSQPRWLVPNYGISIWLPVTKP
jgi:hypothetical protein